jgi:AcrR family transcriptional regulator
MAKLPTKDAAQKKAVVDAALEKFRKYGIRRVTVDEIARELRISKKTFYQYFSNKESLIRACAEQIAAQILPLVKAAVDGPGSATERIMRVWQALSMIPRLVPVEFMADLRADYRHIWEELDSRRRAVLSRIESLVADGIKSGEIAPTVHPKVVLRMWLAMAEKVLTPDVLTLGEFSPAEAIHTALTILTRGMFVNPPKLSA